MSSTSSASSASSAPFALPHDELADLEERVRHALRTGDDRGLDVLGYGEVTLVLRLRTGQGTFACKRLPVFPDRARFERYREGLEEYLERLSRGGLNVAGTQLWHTGQRSRSKPITAYCVQRELPPDRLCSRLLHTEDDTWAKGFFTRFLDQVHSAVTPTLGLDAQAANWLDVEGELTYVDVTTPLMRDDRGRERLDVRLFFTSLPWVLRDAVRLSMTRSIFDKFYEPRGVLLDFLGNLHKERLDGFVPAFLEQANARLERPITADEVAAYYRDDARMWELIQRLRRADRFWHRSVRRRTYPFLLPPPRGAVMPAFLPPPGLDGGVRLDPAHPLRVSHVRGPLTLAVVSVGWLRGRDEPARAALAERHLGAAELAEAAGLRLPRRRLEWLAGRLAAKHAVCGYLRRHRGIAPHPREVAVGAVAEGITEGKPGVNAPVEISISHSADFAVAACAPRPVGVDVERVRPLPPPLAELLSVPPERDGVRAMPLSLRWACKEAVLKHFGVGLRLDTRQVELTRWDPDGRFSWRAGPELRRYAPVADGPRFDSWAREVAGYSVALVWQ